jgi:hypothetical protein
MARSRATIIKTAMAGGRARAIISHREAVAAFIPKMCRQCGSLIEYIEGLKIGDVKAKKFCNLSCAAKYNTPRSNKRRADFCERCGNEIVSENVPNPTHRKYCNQCLPVVRREIAIKNGRLPTGSEYCRNLRYKQLEHEQTEAAKLVDLGFEVFSPTVVCDRVAVKDGKVFFVEFKPTGQKLRPGQQRIKDLVPNMYLVQYS